MKRYDPGGGPKADVCDAVFGIATIAVQDKVSHDVALARVEQAKQRFLATKHDTIATAKSATCHGASIASGTSFTAFLVLLLGGVSAAAAGQVATRRRESL
jgi:hypothetical protein